MYLNEESIFFKKKIIHFHYIFSTAEISTSQEGRGDIPGPLGS
jgi:hypothetical protein